MNTANYKNKARSSALECQWKDAAYYYEMAIKEYPGNKNSALAVRDIELMRSKITAYRRMPR